MTLRPMRGPVGAVFVMSCDAPPLASFVIRVLGEILPSGRRYAIDDEDIQQCVENEVVRGGGRRPGEIPPPRSRSSGEPAGACDPRSTSGTRGDPCGEDEAEVPPPAAGGPMRCRETTGY